MDKQMIEEMAMNRYKKHILFSERKKLADEYEEWVNKPLEDGSKIKDCALSVITFMVSKGYRKIPEGAVVLTMEEHQKYLAFKIIEPQVRGCLDRENKLEKQVRELDKELNLAKSVLSYDDERPLGEWAEHLRKETAEKFAERVKIAFYCHFEELVPSIMSKDIYEICKEITEGK